MLKFFVIALFFVPFFIFLAWLAIGAVGILKSEKQERDSPTSYNPNRAYINWRPRDGWPRGPFLNYECALCKASVGSKQTRETQCECGNVFVGPERIGAKDESQIRLFEEKPDNNPRVFSG